MFVAFYCTSDVFAAEEKLKESGVACDVVPTPVSDKAYCGVCLKISDEKSLELISEFEYRTVEEQ